MAIGWLPISWIIPVVNLAIFSYNMILCEHLSPEQYKHYYFNRSREMFNQAQDNCSFSSDLQWTMKSGSSASASEEILEVLLPTYQRHERPALSSASTTVVQVFIHIIAVSPIRVVEMEYTVDMYLRQIWTDPRLAWDNIPSLMHYENSILITSKRDLLWLPDLFFRNGKIGFTHDMSVPNYLIRVFPNGTVLYSQKITMTFTCSMYLKNFPMDRQECGMNLGSYGYTLDELRFKWIQNDPVTFQKDVRLLEFASPERFITQDCTANGTTSTGTYSCLLLTIPLKRMVTCYLVTTYIPEVLIVMVSWLGFWIDVKVVPARVTLGLFTLLGLLTEGSSVSSNLPRVTYIKAIDVWITVCLLFVISALVEFAFAYLYAPRESSNEWDSEVKDVIERLLKTTLGDCRCCCCYTKSTNHKPICAQAERVKRFGRGCANDGATCARIRINNDTSKLINDVPWDKKLADMVNKDKCCQCPMCRNVKCSKAPTKALSNAKEYGLRKVEFDQSKKCIIICEPQNIEVLKGRYDLNKHGRSPKPIPKKSSLKMTRFTQGDEIPLTDLKELRKCSSAEKCERRREYSERTGLLKNKIPPQRFLPVIRHEALIYDSEVDAYSRFLFPACFLLFNCGYWFYYLIVAND